MATELIPSTWLRCGHGNTSPTFACTFSSTQQSAPGCSGQRRRAGDGGQTGPGGGLAQSRMGAEREEWPMNSLQPPGARPWTGQRQLSVSRACNQGREMVFACSHTTSFRSWADSWVHVQSGIRASEKPGGARGRVRWNDCRSRAHERRHAKVGDTFSR
jgi:hypothetical protein